MAGSGESTVGIYSTGIPNLDALLGGGLPANTMNVVAGEPGTGKTIFAQQAMFHHVRTHPDARVLYLTTLSEPAMKVIRYLQGFTFYDPSLFGTRVIYRDIGSFLREQPTHALLEEIISLVEDLQPDILCIDSFKAIRDLMPAQTEFRRFCYDLSVRLASAACTTLLIGEYESVETAEGAEFAVADGIIQLRRNALHGEIERLITVKKMRGQPMNMGEFTFAISSAGLAVFTPSIALARVETTAADDTQRVPTGIAGLDDILTGGLMPGRSVMLAGVSGSGKTTAGLQFIMEGARRGERGIYYSFEENTERLLRLAEGFGWDLRTPVEQGLVRIVTLPASDVRIDRDTERMIREVSEFAPARVVIDPLSAFLHKVESTAVQRDKVFQLASLMQRTGAAAIFMCDRPHPSAAPSPTRFGVEETLLDGTIILSTDLRAGRRVRYLEVYKMRATDHVRGRHRMDIAAGGLRVFYKTPRVTTDQPTLSSIVFSPVDGIVETDVPYDHAWLVRGGPGSGKSVFAIQFAVERLRSGESVLYVATEASSATILSAMERLGLLTEPYVESGKLLVKSVVDHPELDVEDPESFVNTIGTWVEQMPKPLARVVDSLTPLMIGLTPEEFKAILNKRRLLASTPEVSMFDTVMASQETLQSYLTNHFDIAIDLYTPDWGDLRGADDRGRPVMRVVKARGTGVDTRPYPFRVSRDGGVVVQKDFYGLRG